MNSLQERDTREAIVEAARDLIVTGGLESLSMRKVGQRVGVSATAIYRHFEDKDALLSASVSRGAQVFGSYLMDALSELTPFARLRKMGRRYFDFAREHRYDYQILFMFDCSESNMEKLDERTQEETRQTFVMLVDRVVECQSAGELIAGDPVPLAVYIWASYHGLASLQITDRLDTDEPAFQQLVDQQIDRTLASIRVSPDRASS